MEKHRVFVSQLISLALFALLPYLALAQSAEQSSSEWKPVESALGRSGKLQPDGAFKFAMPRKDLKVTVAGLTIKPGLALGSWAAFSGSGDNAMIMGDLVLTEDEVAPVMAKIQEAGLEVTAVHNHVLHESPRVMYMHIAGHGDAAKLAKGLHDALALTGTPAASAATTTPKVELDTEKIDAALGRKGKDNGGIYQFAVQRSEAIRENGMQVPASMGVATALNFQSTGNGRAAITGDFVLIASEVNPVIKALRENGIQVTALHSHMLGEEPRLYFMHFWANDDAVKKKRRFRSRWRGFVATSSASAPRVSADL
ncbi:MAG: peptidase M23 [Acidobacteria bacterium]|nr:MAG: peptidase M23 [Acidobacteriota bacterium]